MAFTKTNYGMYMASDARSRVAVPCTNKIAVPYKDIQHLYQCIEMHCSLCDMRHNFTLMHTYIIDSPNQMKHFTDYCKDRLIEIQQFSV